MTDKKYSWLIQEFKAEARKLGKKPSWFKFAKKTETGAWKFLANKESQWKKLKKIAQAISRRHSKYTMGEITDMISEIVNQ